MGAANTRKLKSIPEFCQQSQNFGQGGNKMDGYKTKIGAAFLAATFLLTGLETVVDPTTFLIAQTILGTIGTFLTGIGIACKFDKLKG